MSDQDLANGSLGAIGKWDVAFSSGLLVLSAQASDVGVAANVSVSVSGKTVLDALAAKVGGPIPAEVAAFLESAFGLS